MIDDFYNSDNDDELEDISHLVDRVTNAFESGELYNLRFTEEEFDLVIGHFLNEADDNIVYELARMAF